MTHSSPSVPQFASDRGWQTSSAQQLDGQESELQTHSPPTHSVPTPQGADSPQRHSPPRQASARVGLQLVQAAPSAPQVSKVGGAMQSLPLQHPDGQVVALQLEQAPASQGTPSSQGSQAMPPRPQASSVVPERQVVPSQHPVQDTESQTQAPARQRWPIAQASPSPQTQAPVSSQVSERVALQLVQRLPETPQVASDGDSQVFPAQQPSGQEVALQTQVPPSQNCPG